jgi:DNA-binding LacI/PurR family transcriptional regulator
MAGYMDCMKDNGLDVDESHIYRGDLHERSGHGFADYIADNAEGCTAVFAANDIMGAALVERLLSRGIGVPGDISVICADDTGAARAGRVALTTISYDPVSMGEAAAGLMLERFEEPNGQKKKIMYFPEIKERESIAEARNR